jgi:hypothetical protein
MSRGAKPGERRGGRKAGTPNKNTAAVQAAAGQVLEELGADPFDGDGYALLALVYKNKKLPLSVRLSAAGQAMPYERPRLSNVEMTTRSLDKLSDEDFFRAWDSVARTAPSRSAPKRGGADHSCLPLRAATDAANMPF